tara:strand:+ start:942 stop:1712 length:771 start_codon:yes stop_codon:yes gene_type:complete
MAEYTAAQETEATGILSQIYSSLDRDGRLRLAERLGYGGTDASKLRSLRRILAGEIRYGSKVNVTRFFRPTTTVDDPFPLRRVPDIRIGSVQPDRIRRNPDIGGLYQIVSQVMYVRETELGLVSFASYLNSGASRNISRLFEDYNQRAAEVYQTDFEQNPRASPGIIAIAFSDRGARELAQDYDVSIPQVIATENEGVQSVSSYGVALVPGGTPTTQGYGRQSSFGTRRLPKSRRNEIIRYVRSVSKRVYGIPLQT